MSYISIISTSVVIRMARPANMYVVVVTAIATLSVLFLFETFYKIHYAEPLKPQQYNEIDMIVGKPVSSFQTQTYPVKLLTNAPKARSSSISEGNFSNKERLFKEVKKIDVTIEAPSKLKLHENVNNYSIISRPKIDILSRSIICPSETTHRYSSIDETNAKNYINWCEQMKNTYHVVLGRSWGSLPSSKKEEWEKNRCNEVISSGKILPCSHVWGWGMFDDWLKSKKTVVQGVTTMTCGYNVKASQFCKIKNAIIDFSKANIHGSSRDFSTGFLQTYGQRISMESPAPGHQHHESTSNKLSVPQDCEEYETRPTFFISHDDIFNLGHHMNDVIMVWAMGILAGHLHNNSLLVNMDGIREGGPAGVGAHRLMVPSDPDALGPFVGYYDSWFPEIKRSIQYKNKRVCYSNIYFQPFPGVPWFWNDWGRINECSLQGPSPLYQSFNIFLRERWLAKFGEDFLPSPNEKDILVVIEARAINPHKTNKNSIARHIVNIDKLVSSLSTIPNVKAIAQDFAKLSFDKQVALAHSASILISMHGAGTTHLFHMALGQPNCCALIELQPSGSFEYRTAVGFGNLARMHGMHYYRHDARDGATGDQGTTVDVVAIRNIVEKAVMDVKLKPTCLNDVRNTVSYPIYED